MTACQSPNHPRGSTPLTFMELTFQGASIPAKGAQFPGATWTEIACQSCASPRTDAVRAEGGTLVAAEMLPPPPAPVQPEPVGLDAIDPTPAPVEPPAQPIPAMERLSRLRERLALRTRRQEEPSRIRLRSRTLVAGGEG